MRPDPLLLQNMLNLFIDGINLAGGITTTDDKVIGKTTYVSGIQQDNVNCLLVTGCLNHAAGYVYRFQKLILHIRPLL
jgi:hypothetical protein